MTARRAHAALAGAALWALVGCSTLPAETGPAEGGDDTPRGTIHVPGDVTTLAEAAAQVRPGGTIVIAPGTYAEQLQIDTPDVTVRGESRNDTIIDGGGLRPFGIVVTADGVRVENLTVARATFYGVMFTGLHDDNGPSAPTLDGYSRWDPSDFPPLKRFHVDHVTAHNNGLYGIYAFNARHGVIRDSYASGSSDSGIYVGQCTECDILVTGNIAERNAVGFENSNASDSVVVVGNRFSGNRIGITLLSSYQEAFTPQRANRVVGNLIVDNAEAASPAHAEGAFATGIGISGGRDNIIERNLISGHARAGIILTNTEDLPAAGNRLIDNVFAANGTDVANTSAARTPATGNCSAAYLLTWPAQLVDELVAACGGSIDAQSASTDELAPAAPRGLSFTKVPAPRPQPQLAATAWAPLPPRVTMPELSTFPTPDRSLLSALSGAR
ncbi:right-handed parallel beta-helix repeat-containing protein [Salinibacterium sp. ZJ77]|uniref:right-handed parallel beta-helix repeat-containing protein n=1 Tax=Salinibacterium sp. ZJ77 TaxID=2708337 RepID=UPI001421A5CD|nr:right-handed parallel beta-helix repeat-containing protein [Salinibacterium sp. ZJ77]